MCGGGGSCIGGYLLCLWVKIKWVCSGDHGRSVVGFFGGVSYFGMGFSGNMVQVVGLFDVG